MPAIAAAINGAPGTTRTVYFPKESKLSERPPKLLTFSHTRPLTKTLIFDSTCSSNYEPRFSQLPLFGTFYVVHLPFNPNLMLCAPIAARRMTRARHLQVGLIGLFTALMNGPTVPRIALRNGPPSGNKRRMLFQVTYEKEGA